MAWSRKYYKKGYKGYWRGGKTLTPKKSFKRSAANMTQNGLFNISTVAFFGGNMALQQPTSSTTPNVYAYMENVDVPGLILNSKMHSNLKKVFDQYRVEKLTLKVTISGTTYNSYSMNMFSVIDRTGFFAEDVTLDTLKTYGSYKEVSVPSDGSASKVLYVNVSNTDLVFRSLYSDTYNKASFPSAVLGCYVVGPTEAKGVTFSVEVDAQIRYRGVRYSGKA